MSPWPVWNIQRALFIAVLLVLASATATAFAQKADTKDTRSSSKTQSTKAVSKAANPTRYETIRISKPDGSVVTLRVPRDRPLSRIIQPPVYRPARGNAPKSSSMPITERAESTRPTTRLHSSSGITISHPIVSRQPLSITDTLTKRLLLVTPPARVSENATVAGDDPTEWRTGRGWAPGGEEGDGGDYLSDSTEFAYIEPGSGWKGPTDDPPPVGDESKPGYEATVIARWDVVPFQTISEPFHVGVVAFHVNGVDRVEFSVNDGPWVPVSEMQFNPRTKVWEYVVVLDPSVMGSDGLVEIRAVAYPKVAGAPRLLAGEFDADAITSGEHSLSLWTNAGGTLPQAVVWCSPAGSDETGDGSKGNPFRNPYKALQSVGNSEGDARGALCLLEEGTYSWGPYSFPRFDTENRWATIAAAPGAKKENVIIDTVGSSGMRTQFIRILNCTITTQLTTASSPPASVWLDNCDVIGPGRYTNYQILFAQNWLSAYFTDCSITDATNAYDSVTMARNITAERLGSDAFSRSRLIINATVNDIDAGNTDYHPDLFQISGNSSTVWDNTILYNVRGTNISAQGLFADDVAEVNNIAFVNVCIQVTSPVLKSQWKDIFTNHLLIWNSTLIDQPFVWRANTISNLSVRGNIWQKVEGTIADDGFESNHYIESDSYAAITPGTDISDGDPMFNDPDAFDFSPAPNSPLRNRLNLLSPIADFFGTKREAPASLGAFAPLESTQ